MNEHPVLQKKAYFIRTQQMTSSFEENDVSRIQEFNGEAKPIFQTDISQEACEELTMVNPLDDQEE